MTWPALPPHGDCRTQALPPDGWLVISDFPFSDDDEGLRSVPGPIMCAIRFLEAHIDDQLLPHQADDEMPARHEFPDLGSAQLACVHALTWGRRT